MASTTARASTAAPDRLNRAAWSWALFQGVRDPYVILVAIYIFAPYIVGLVGDPVKGQALIAAGAKYTGWIVMLTAPLLGATVDRMGPRKPWLAAVVLLMVPLIFSLWWVHPGGLTPVQAVVITAACGVLFAYSETLHNALLLPAAGMRKAGHASGLGLAAGNFFSVLMLAGVLWAFALPGKVAWSFVPAVPLFGLDRAAHEPDRIAGPLIALVLAAGALPLFRFVPDVAATGVRLGAAVRSGAGDLVQLAREARGYRDGLLYLGARMLFTDGLTGILIFTGIYAAGQLGWGTLELVSYGLILSCAAVIGGLTAGWLDTKVGPKPALTIELIAVIISQLLSLGQTRTTLFYEPFNPAAHMPVWSGPMFHTLPEFALIGCGLLGAISVTAAYASSRTMVTRVVPPAKIGVFFGLFVIAGNATLWLAPLLVQLATSVSGSQRIGLLPIDGLLLAGLIVLQFVRGGKRLR
jgi:UMF1 family MFS transporter